MSRCNSKTKTGRRCKAAAIGRGKKCVFHTKKKWSKKTKSKKSTSWKKNYRRR